MTAPRLLLLLGQSPFDPTSGAAQSMRQTAELLADAGWSVRCLATSGCEGPVDADHATMLLRRGLSPSSGRSFANSGVAVLELTAAGVHHEIVLSLPGRERLWERDVGAAFAAHLGRLVDGFRPDVVLTFGGDPADERRRERLRAAGAKIVFALHNLAYLGHRPAHCDAFLAPTEFVASRYRTAWATEIAVLPTVIVPDGVVAPAHDPVFVTFVNPEPAKGLWLVARIAQRLAERRPDIPLLVVDGRATAAGLLAAGRAGGEDLARHASLMFTPAVPRVADLWSHCRIVLVPSVVDEAAGRVALEAMINGAVPVVANRGALPETVGSGGIVLPLPDGYGPVTNTPLPPAAADPWVDVIEHLADDEAAYARASLAAREIATRHLPAVTGPRYAAWFGAMSGRSTGGDREPGR
jgi:glycosyltransferase involved in cell wall biosynthesis